MRCLGKDELIAEMCKAGCDEKSIEIVRKQMGFEVMYCKDCLDHEERDGHMFCKYFGGKQVRPYSHCCWGYDGYEEDDEE